jgi:hypothetical protein
MERARRRGLTMGFCWRHARLRGRLKSSYWKTTCWPWMAGIIGLLLRLRRRTDVHGTWGCMIVSLVHWQRDVVADCLDLYVRLFWSEKHQGWNREEWPIYARNIAALIFIQLAILLVIRGLLDRHDACHDLALPRDNAVRHRSRIPLLKSITVLSLANIFLILSIFALGRMSVFPHRGPIVQMPTYGCCTQGLLYPSTRIPTVLRYLRQQAELERQQEAGGIWVDQTIEKFANKEHELRWAIVSLYFY